MLIRSENSLNQLVRIAWELGLAAENRNPGNQYEVMLDAIAAHLHATGWSWHKGTWSSDLLHPEMTWSQSNGSPLFPLDIQYLKMSFQWRDSIEKAVARNALISAVVPYESEANEGSTDPWHLLMHIIACPDGYVECVAFAKPTEAGLFTELEREFVAAMLANLNGVPVPAATNGTEVVAETGLPKRQREVLELLLQGASLKEIASELRISRHTVNDYSKALYRHFNVSGRAELAAIFRHLPQHELSHAE